MIDDLLMAASDEALSVASIRGELGVHPVREVCWQMSAILRKVHELGASPGHVLNVSARRRETFALGLWTALAGRMVYRPLDWQSTGSPTVAGFTLTDAPLAGNAISLEGPLGAWLEGPEVPVDALRRFEDDVAYLLPTSGSTGHPKTIVGSRRGLQHFIDWEVNTLSLPIGVTVAALTPPTFDPSLRDMLVPGSVGGTLVIPPREWDLGITPAELGKWILANEVQVIHCVPALFRTITRSAELGFDLSPLEYILVAGEQLFGADIAAWEKADAAHVKILNMYGPSETTLAKFAYVVTASDASADRVPIGKPICGASAVILKSDGSEAALWEAGELVIETPFASHGYLDDPILTAANFSASSSDGVESRAFRTGDVCYRRPDGEVVFMDRLDRIVKMRGRRVDLGVIEASIRRYPSVTDAAVKTERGPGGEVYISAYFCADGDLDTDALRGHLVEDVGPEAVPALIIRMVALPRTGSGKIDYLALPDADRVAPAGCEWSLEAELADIWSACLPLGVCVTPDAGFESLGARSLEVVSILIRLNEAYDGLLSIGDLYEFGTIRRTSLGLLARALSENSENSVSLAVLSEMRRSELDALWNDARAWQPRTSYLPVVSNTLSPVSPAQRRIAFLEERFPMSPALRFLWVAKICGNFEEERLAAAMTSVSTCHEAFRLGIQTCAGGVHLAIREVAAPLTAQVSSEETGLDLLCQAAIAPLDLAAGGLLRFAYLSTGPKRGLLGLLGHIAMSDAATKRIVLRDLFTAYAGNRQIEATTFREHAQKLADRADSARLRNSEWWRRALGSVGRPLWNETSPSHKYSRHDYDLDVNTLRSLGESSSSSATTAILSAFSASIAEVTGRTAFHINVPVGNRSHAGSDRIPGCFADTLPLGIVMPSVFSMPQMTQMIQNYLGNWFQRSDSAADHIFADALASFGPVGPLQVMFAPQPEVHRHFSLPGVNVTPFASPLAQPIFDLELYSWADGEEPRISFRWNATVEHVVDVNRILHRTLAHLGSSRAAGRRTSGAPLD